MPELGSQPTAARLHQRAQVVLHNSFIPHEGNDYQPHFLHPQRLFVYGTAAVIAKVIAFAFVALLPLTAWVTPDVYSDQARQIIALTNEVRSVAQVAPLHENKILAQAAADKVTDMIIDQYFAHVSPSGHGLKYWLTQARYGYLSAGENLAIGFAEPRDVVNAWQNSPTHNRNLLNPSFTEIGVALDSGAYHGYDTTFVAQFFGRPLAATEPATTSTATASEPPTTTNTVVASTPTAPPPVAATATTTSSTAPIVLGEAVSADAAATTAVGAISSTPAIAPQMTLTVINAGQGDAPQRIVRAEGVLPQGVARAEVHFAHYTLALQPQTPGDATWSGSMVVFGSDAEVFNPIVLPTLTTYDQVGKSQTVDIAWANIQPVNPSVLDRYFLAKRSWLARKLSIFTISSTLYKALLGVVVVSLLLNIFIQIRKQNYRVIAASIVFIILISLLIFF